MMRSFLWLAAVAVAAEDCQLADEGTMLQIGNRKILATQTVVATQADMGSGSFADSGLESHPAPSGATVVGRELRELEVGQAAAETLRDDPDFTAGVACCSTDRSLWGPIRRGSKWTSELACGPPGHYYYTPPAAHGASCSRAVTFAAAREVCSGFGLRLCLATEVAACYFTGCRLSGEHNSGDTNIWIEPAPSGATVVGRQLRGLEVGQAASVTLRDDPDFTAGVACCSTDRSLWGPIRRGSKWTSELACGPPGHYYYTPPAAHGASCSRAVTFAAAREVCSGFGLRLCLATEVAACYFTGCRLSGEHNSGDTNIWIEPGPSFSCTQGAQNGHNQLGAFRRGYTKERCEQECLSNPACLSYDTSAGDGAECYLSTTTAETGGGLRAHDAGYEYCEKRS